MQGNAKDSAMAKKAIDLGGFVIAVGALASPALAGLPVTPQPEIVGGLGALVAFGLGYRWLRNRAKS